NLKRGWGYSVFIEHGGRRILFDTGGNSAGFAENVATLKIDLKRLDLVVITQRHNDHTAGLAQVVRENPAVTVCTPLEGAGFETPTPAPLMKLIRRNVPSLPDDLRYFGGHPPDENHPDSPWH